MYTLKFLLIVTIIIMLLNYVLTSPIQCNGFVCYIVCPTQNCPPGQELHRPCCNCCCCCSVCVNSTCKSKNIFLYTPSKIRKKYVTKLLYYIQVWKC